MAGVVRLGDKTKGKMMLQVITRARTAAVILAVVGALGVSPAQAQEAGEAKPSSAPVAEQPKPHGEQAVAKVNDRYITWYEFNSAIAQAARNRFYHGSVPEGEMVGLRNDVLDDLIISVLLSKDVKARDIKGDEEAVEKELATYDLRYAGSEQWKSQRDTVLPRLREELLGRSKIKALEADVRNIEEPSEAELQLYYGENPSKFTEPMQERVAVILLGVDPSSTRDVWLSAKDEAEKIHEKLSAGGDFASIAKLRSSDGSATDGGDMGYLHRGMLSTPAQEAVDKLKVGEFTEPVELLQGYAVFKLLDRKEPKLKPFEEAKERARDLLMRERSEKAWEDYKAKLRADAKIEVSPTFEKLQAEAEAKAKEAEEAAKKDGEKVK